MPCNPLWLRRVERHHPPDRQDWRSWGIELLARDFQERRGRPAAVEQAVKAILDPAEKGRSGEDYAGLPRQ